MAISWGRDGGDNTGDTGTPCERRVEQFQVNATGEAWNVRVWTTNSLYEMAVIDAARLKVMVHGGRHFAKASLARVAGARETTTEIWLGGIRVGLPLEFHVDGKVIVTSPVRRIELEEMPRALPRPGLPRPH